MPFSLACQRLIKELRDHGIQDDRVLSAIEAVPRERFVAEELSDRSYENCALPIASGQTISQPYIVALMSQAAELSGSERVLEIGTGSGYQAAVLSNLAKEVISIERHAELAETAMRRLRDLEIGNVRVVVGDGTLGGPLWAPYDAILVTAAAPDVPRNLLSQLAEGGRMVIPVGNREHQRLLQIVRDGSRFSTKELCQCRFVKLIGQHGWDDKQDFQQ